MARVLMATAGLRRFTARLGKVTIIAGLTVLVGSLAAYEAEHATNPEFGGIGDALWWGCVTMTTVGYGDIVPQTTPGRIAGIAMMIAGIAVIGVLAGSLASLFGLDRPVSQKPASGDGAEARPVYEELALLKEQLGAMELRLGELADRTRAEVGGPPP